MPMLATASGITAGAIYKHFESKSDSVLQGGSAHGSIGPYTHG
jgi:hypothetical protein